MYLIETIAAIKSGIGAILLTLIVLVNELERILLVGLSLWLTKNLLSPSQFY